MSRPGPRFVMAASAVLAACSSAPDAPQPAATPASVAEELLAADRAFAGAAAQTDLISAITAMFAADVIVPAPGGIFLEGIEPVRQAYAADSLNAHSRAAWAPVRAGISADGQHGFTFGYMQAHRPDSSVVHYKYLAYWIRRPEGWRVQAFKRGGAPAPQSIEMPPSLPAALQEPATDEARIAAFRESLAEAERSFSRDAQSIGLGPAFARYGSADAVNMGPPDGPWVVGADAIGANVGGDEPAAPSPLSWGPDHRVIVASSGDLGITFGFIRSNADAQRPPFPFFTIWRRPDTTSPWRYIAE